MSGSPDLSPDNKTCAEQPTCNQGEMEQLCKDTCGETAANPIRMDPHRRAVCIFYRLLLRSPRRHVFSVDHSQSIKSALIQSSERGKAGTFTDLMHPCDIILSQLSLSASAWYRAGPGYGSI